MLSTSYEEGDELITVPYGPIFDEIRRNSGFVDVRGRPDLAAQIPEGAGSPNLKTLLIALSDATSPLFTLGCDLGTHAEREHGRIRYGAGGYIHVMKTTFAVAASDDYLDLARAVSAEIDKRSADHDWELQHVNAWVDFRLDRDLGGVIPSLQTWFIARADSVVDALASREIMIAQLHGALLHSGLNRAP